MKAIGTYIWQFRTIGRINSSVRKLHKKNIAVGIISPSHCKHTISPKWSSVTGKTLYQAGRLNDRSISNIEGLLGRLIDIKFDQNIGREKILGDTLVLEEMAKDKIASTKTEEQERNEKIWGKISQIKETVKALENHGLSIPFFKPFFGSLGLRMLKANSLYETSEFSYILSRILKAYGDNKKNGKEVSEGSLDWNGFLERYHSLVQIDEKMDENTGEFKLQSVTSEYIPPKDELQAEQLMAAVADNLILAKGLSRQEAFARILEIINKEGDFRAKAIEVLKVIKKWLPGGSPTLMLFAWDKGKPCLVSEAVALGYATIKMGERYLKKKLGEIKSYFSIDVDEYQDVSDGKELAAIDYPQNQAFARGEVKIELINYKMYCKICANFIGKKKLNWLEKTLMAWVSWPGKRDDNTYFPILWVPLIHPVLKQKLGLIAVLAKEIDEKNDVEYMEKVAEATVNMLIREKMNKMTRGYLGPKVVSALEQQGFESFRPKKVEDATIMFVDISGSTRIGSVLADQPEKSVTLVQTVLWHLASIVVKHGGRVDKYMGDALLADWGLLDEERDITKEVESAINAAIEIQRTIPQINLLPEIVKIIEEYIKIKAEIDKTIEIEEENEIVGEEDIEIIGEEDKSGRKESLESLGLTIGINTGTVVAANFGLEEGKIDFTSYGDTVNVAARIQHEAERGHILISDSAYDWLSPEYKGNTVKGFNDYNRVEEEIRKFVLGEYEQEGRIVGEAGIADHLNLFTQIDEYLKDYYQDATEDDIFRPYIFDAKNKGPVLCYFIDADRHAWRYPFLVKAGITLDRKSQFENQPLAVLETWNKIKHRRPLRRTFLKRLKQHHPLFYKMIIEAQGPKGASS